MEPTEQEPLMWTKAAAHTVETLVKQLHRLIAHHNSINPPQHVDLAKLELHFPEHQITQRHELTELSYSAD